MSNEWYTKKWIGISLHILFWVLFLILPFLLRPVMDNDSSSGHVKDYSRFIILYLINNTLRILLFYGNAYLFIPKLIYRRKYIEYILVLIAALIVFFITDRLFFNLLFKGSEHSIRNFFVFNLYPFLFVLIASAAFRMIRDRIDEQQRSKEKETENLKTELSFLRSQVSPHFMFNVLNNMVALARKKSDELEPSLIKLSSLLRYMLYETDEDKVLLEKEVEYLQSYIDLQQQRFGKNVSINTSFQKIENAYTIEPMLLIPFVENAFKHGTGLITNAQIDISLKVETGTLQFFVRNKYNDVTDMVKDKTSGIGLNNVKRRLNLLYEKSYSLHIEKKEGWFEVLLQLNLH
jgi:two-component system, LytTR family, sensor kinase